MTERRFHGRERITIELDGTLSAAALALPAGLELDPIDGRARVSLFAFDVEKLRITGIPLARWSYPEILWRVAVRRGSEPAWWIVACDLEARGPRWAAKRYVRYEVRAHAVEVTERRVGSRGNAGDFVMILDEEIEPVQLEPNRLLLVGADASWQVPWGDDDTPATRTSVLVETDSLSVTTLGAPVLWAGDARVRRGRQHRCGVAHR